MKITPALEWAGGAGGHLELLDQRQLPGRLEKIRCERIEQLFDAISTLAVRGAPAIGVAAAYGMVLALREIPQGAAAREVVERLRAARDYLASSRPTAVNLSWALERVLDAGVEAAAAGSGAVRGAVFAEAKKIHEEDVAMCRRIGENGERFISDGAGVLTHCNAGALATSGQGTALSVFFEAHAGGKRFAVYACETRPLLQGARLTAWELGRAGLEVTLLCDNMAGWLMKRGKIDAVITGADRIAANGDAANKIGTFSLAVLASRHNVPFYIAAPTSTFDPAARDGAAIPIEERNPEEVACFAGVRTAPEGVRIFNPAFDVTDAGLITAIITERGVIDRPDTSRVKKHLRL